MGTIKITCLGDVLPADTSYSMGQGIGSKVSDIIKHYSSSDLNPFHDADIVFCNLEAPVFINPENINLPFTGNPEVIKLLRILGINIVSIANNHILDHGLEGFLHTIKNLKESGISPIGLNENHISNVIILERKGKKFAFAGFNSIQDHPDNKLVASLKRNILYSTLEEIKKQCPDYILFSFHWGNEYVSIPSPDQVGIAHELIDSGVNVIIGHHPHVVQPVEKYHDGIIIYSLGNFLFDMFWSEPVKNGMYIDLVFHEDRPIQYKVNAFRIKSDFIQDYSYTDTLLLLLAKSDKKFELLQAGTYETYQKEYLYECKKRRFQARLLMKVNLLKNVFYLSPRSKTLLISNIRKKLSF